MHHRGDAVADADAKRDCRCMCWYLHEQAVGVDGRKLDAFMLGVVAFVLATGSFPFRNTLPIADSGSCPRWRQQVSNAARSFIHSLTFM